MKLLCTILCFSLLIVYINAATYVPLVTLNIYTGTNEPPRISELRQGNNRLWVLERGFPLWVNKNQASVATNWKSAFAEPTRQWSYRSLGVGDNGDACLIDDIYGLVRCLYYSETSSGNPSTPSNWFLFPLPNMAYGVQAETISISKIGNNGTMILKDEDGIVYKYYDVDGWVVIGDPSSPNNPVFLNPVITSDQKIISTAGAPDIKLHEFSGNMVWKPKAGQGFGYVSGGSSLQEVVGVDRVTGTLWKYNYQAYPGIGSYTSLGGTNIWCASLLNGELYASSGKTIYRVYE